MNKRATDVLALKKLMIEKGFNGIGSLAKTAGINRVTLGNILSGKAQPSAEVMIKLVDALEIAPEKAGEIFFSHDLRIA